MSHTKNRTARLSLETPKIEESSYFSFEAHESGPEKSFVTLPFHKKTTDTTPTAPAITLEIERRWIGEDFAYAIGKVEKDYISVTRTHFSDVARFLGVPDTLPVYDTYKVGLFNAEKTNQLLRLANMSALFTALGKAPDEGFFIPTIEQTCFQINHEDDLQSARAAFMQHLAPRRNDPHKPQTNKRQFGIIDGGKSALSL